MGANDQGSGGSVPEARRGGMTIATHSGDMKGILTRAARRIPGHGLSRHPGESWRRADGRCVCDRAECPNNSTGRAAIAKAEGR
jgi:hypothetical protein